MLTVAPVGKNSNEPQIAFNEDIEMLNEGISTHDR